MATIKVKRSAVAGRVPATTDLELGEIAINTYDGVAYIKKSVSGTDSVVQIGSANLSQNLQNRYQYIASAGQTTFAATYLAPYVDVYLNGIRLIAGVDYTATSGTNIVLASGASVNNTVDIVGYTSYTANANFADLTSSHVTTALGYTPENPANKGVANGYASLNSSGQIPSVQLPSFVDDVVEYANLAGLPATGETGKIYVTQDTNKTYRWSGSAYTEIASSPGSTDAVTEGSSNLYFTNARARNALSATQNLTYSSSTGVFTGPDLSGYLTSATAATVYAPLASPSFTGNIATAGQIILNNNNYVGFKNSTGSVTCSVFQDTSNDLWLYNGAATNLKLYTDNTERFRISGSGNISTYSVTGDAFTIFSPMAKVASSSGWGITVSDTNSDGVAGRGGAISFGAMRTDGGRFNAAAIGGAKSNSTGTNENGDLVLYSSVASSLTERLRIASGGAFGLSGANYGTTGQVLTSQGSGAAPIWSTASGGGGSAATPTALGTVYGSMSSSSTNTGSGYNSMAAITSGTANTGIGLNTLAQTTTGANNAAGGAYALWNNTTGGFNSAFGMGALQSNTTASNNTAVGYQSGYTNTTGTDNSFFGLYAGYGNTTGSYNTAIGRVSLFVNTTGQYNTAIGTEALRLNTTASGNTAVGYQAGYNNLTGASNVFVGRNAGYAVTGGQNTIIGDAALNVGTANDGANTVVGGSAGQNISGGLNTAVGHNAMRFQGSGSGNSAFGYGSLGLQNSPTVHNFSNSTAIGANSLAFNRASDNTAVGYFAAYSNTTGTLNVAVGVLALRNSTTANYNTAVGYGAGYSNTTGAQFTAIGYQALYSNTTAADNTAVGFQALYANTTGDISVAIGRNALKDQTTATQNVAIGYNAANKITTSGYNVAIGQAALGSMVNGAQGNVALGQGALGAYVNTSVYEGGAVAVGQGALQYCTTGGSNVAMGRNAGHTLTTGASNVIIGDRAGESANSSSGVYVGAFCGLYTTGNNNTFVGWQAGHYETSTTTGAQNVYLGAGAKGSGVSNSYEIVVGAFATGKGSNTGFINPGNSGVYQGNNSSSWSTTSDQRLKKNIADNNIGLDAITAIRVRNFEYRLPEEVDTELKPADAVIKSGVQLGVIAQELQAVLPECVKQESTGVLSVDTDNLTWYLINAVKELSARVKQLEGK